MISTEDIKRLKQEKDRVEKNATHKNTHKKDDYRLIRVPCCVLLINIICARNFLFWDFSLIYKVNTLCVPRIIYISRCKSLNTFQSIHPYYHIVYNNPSVHLSNLVFPFLIILIYYLFAHQILSC